MQALKSASFKKLYLSNTSNFSKYQTVTIMIVIVDCYCFDGPWKVKAKYIVSCLNAFAKLKKW